VPNVQLKTPDDGQRNCQKHVEFLDKNNFGKLVRLLVLLKKICYDARSHERKKFVHVQYQEGVSVQCQMEVPPDLITIQLDQNAVCAHEN